MLDIFTKNELMLEMFVEINWSIDKRFTSIS